MTESKILIVEDESIVALDLKSRLSRLGYQVVGTVGTGNEAIETALRHHPDLILIDIHLQGAMDGITAAQTIQQQYAVPIVYLTAHSDTGTLGRAKQTQPHGYLGKPFNERELHTTIEMALFRHTMEQRIHQQTQQLQSIIEAMPQGVVLLDPARRILSANYLGQNALMALGKLRIGDIVHHLGTVDIATLLHQSPSGLWHEVSAEIDSSTPLVYEVIASPQPNGNGDNEWVLLLRDATRERAIQRQIQQQHHLAAVGQLAAGIAHDFNNILTILSMTLQLINLTQPNLTEENQQRLQTNIEQVDRGAALIRQVLDFSKQSSLSPQTLNLVPVVGETVKMIDRILPENIQFKFLYETETCPVIADPTQVQQVVMNLIINARDAMPSGGHLTLNLKPVVFAHSDLPPFPGMAGQAWVRMAITDDGTGMPPEVRERIFEPFFTTKDRHRGTGLGLAQVYGILRQHGGFIDVRSVPGAGSTFTLYWPAPNEIVDIETTDDTVEIHSWQKGLGQTVLFVEDDEEVRQSIVEILRLLNYRVIEAACGNEVKAILEQRGSEINLVITDMVMPEMTGAELCRLVKQHYPALEVILLTGYTMEDFAEEVHAAGFAHMMQKPVSVTALAEITARILRRTPTDTKWISVNDAPTIAPAPLVPREANTLNLYIIGTDQPLTYSGHRTLILGRLDNNGTDAESTLVDLMPHGALDLGVSRRHARIRCDPTGYHLEDLGSRNGTRVNGHRLSPHQPYLLRSGDQVSVGDLIFFVYFQRT